MAARVGTVAKPPRWRTDRATGSQGFPPGLCPADRAGFLFKAIKPSSRAGLRKPVPRIVGRGRSSRSWTLNCA